MDQSRDKVLSAIILCSYCFLHFAAIAVGKKWASRHLSNEKQTFYLKKGEQLSFLFHIDPVLPDGHHASIGYILDDQYQVFARGSLKEQAYAEFEASEDGEYKFFLWCTATDTIHVSSLTIK